MLAILTERGTQTPVSYVTSPAFFEFQSRLLMGPRQNGAVSLSKAVSALITESFSAVLICLQEYRYGFVCLYRLCSHVCFSFSCPSFLLCHIHTPLSSFTFLPFPLLRNLFLIYGLSHNFWLPSFLLTSFSFLMSDPASSKASFPLLATSLSMLLPYFSFCCCPPHSLTLSSDL